MQLLYTIQQARTLLIGNSIGINEWERICREEIPYISIGRKKLYDAEDIKAWIKKNKNIDKEKTDFEIWREKRSR